MRRYARLRISRHDAMVCFPGGRVRRARVWGWVQRGGRTYLFRFYKGLYGGGLKCTREPAMMRAQDGRG